jgi:Flp pilus assembly protein TadB
MENQSMMRKVSLSGLKNIVLNDKSFYKRETMDKNEIKYLCKKNIDFGIGLSLFIWISFFASLAFLVSLSYAQWIIIPFSLVFFVLGILMLFSLVKEIRYYRKIE